MIGRIIVGVATGLALLGGALLLIMTAMVCLSILGRTLIPFGLRPIPGDVELVEMGTALAVFAMLPYGHLIGANARVDLFARAMGRPVAAALDLVANIGLLLVSFVVCWTLFNGLRDKLAFVETTFILGLPLWIGYAGGVACVAVLIAVAAYRVMHPGTKAEP